MRHFFVGLCCALLLFTGHALAAPKFPALTGRVVDEARILSDETKSELNQFLLDYEQKTTNQIVVATIPTLDNLPIEEYGVALGRHWGIGQKGKNNGALLIIAPLEREVRIEVGYGLEGTLTDAISSQIIDQVILPDFRNGKIEQGVIDGTKAIISVLGGEDVPALKASASPPPLTLWEKILALIGILALVIFYIRYPALAIFILQILTFILQILTRGGGGRGGSSSGGGGGSFGGGGASGR